MQTFEKSNSAIAEQFSRLRQQQPDRLREPLKLSWSNWGFGMEPLSTSACRLQQAGIRFIELHGNHYGEDLGYRPQATVRLLGDHGLQVAGICGMFSAENDLSSPSGVVRQRALDYLKRTLDFAAEVQAEYLLVVPGAVGRPQPYDEMEFARSVESLRLVADRFVQAGVKAAIEPIRAEEVSFCHTVAQVQDYLAAVDHPGVQHINADVFHMQTQEAHVGRAVLQAGERLTNLHLADSNRGALGEGSLDVDTLLRALYVIHYNRPGCYLTPEPLGPGGDPYLARYGRPAPEQLDRLVQQTVRYLREREAAVVQAH